jgi:hypothetical protein
MKKTIFISFAAILLCSIGVARAHYAKQTPAGGNIRIEDFKEAFQDKEPIKITGLYMGSKEVKSGEDFPAGEHWLPELRVMIKNVSTETIKQVVLNLDLPTGDERIGIRRVEMRYGRDYFNSRTPFDDQAPDVALAPGAVAMFGFNQNKPDLYERFIKHIHNQHQATLPARGRISLGVVVFEDIDKGWSAPGFAIRTANGWAADPARPYLFKKQARANGSATMLKASYVPSPQCWKIPEYPQPLSTPVLCTDGTVVPPATMPAIPECVGCAYGKPILNGDTEGWNRVQMSDTCYHTIGGNINTSDPCPCCQLRVWHPDFTLCA